MDDLEVIIKRFGNKRERRKNLVAMQEHMMPHCHMPYSAVEVLDVLVQKLIEGRLEKQIVVVEAKGRTNLTFTSKQQTKRGMIGYCVAHMFSRYHYLGGTSPEHKQVRFIIDPWDTITFEDLFGKGPQTFVLDEGEYFDCMKIPKELYACSKGVAIMKTVRDQGDFVLGTNRYNFGLHFHPRYVFTFFENGNAFFFDTNGNMIFPTLSQAEVFDQKRLERILPIKEAFDGYTSDESIEDHILNEWSRAPQSYTRYALIFLIKAQARRSVIGRGNVKFYHYQDEHLCKKIYAGINQRGRQATVMIRGRNLLVFSEEGELLNGLTLTTPGAVVKDLKKTDVEEAVLIRTIAEGKKPIVSLSKTAYAFSGARVNKMSQGADHRAVMIHKSPEGNRYDLCLKTGDEVTRHPLDCIYTC